MRIRNAYSAYIQLAVMEYTHRSCYFLAIWIFMTSTIIPELDLRMYI